METPTVPPELLDDFTKVMQECLKNKELVREFNRLQGTHIGQDARTPFIKAIDQSTGYQAVLDKQNDEEFKLFADFIFRYIYLPTLCEVNK